MPSKSRFIQIDYMKGILNIGMIFAHTVQFFSKKNDFYLISELMNLVCFSGFLFCFGFASWSSYFSKANIPYRSHITVILKCYLAYIISGVSYCILVSKELLNSTLVYKVISLENVPGYSEFLIAFVLFALLGLLFSEFINLLTKNIMLILTTSIACLLISLILTDIKLDNRLELFIGGRGKSYFPVLQYTPLYLLGIYFSRYSTKPSNALNFLALVIISIFLYFKIARIDIVRFPPSAAWILFSTAAVYLCFSLSNWLSKHLLLLSVVLNMGKNVLFYLIITNIILFTLTFIGFKNYFETQYIFILFAVILFLPFYLTKIITPDEKINSLPITLLNYKL
jgi:hypothetical protein